MTENEAKEYLLNRYLVVGSPANPPKEECEKHNDVLDVAIYALEAIQAYRAIGTVEGYKRAVEVSKENYYLCAEYKARLKKFEAIGTVEEFKALKEKNKPKKAKENLVDVEVYNSGGFTKKEVRKYCPVCKAGLTREKYCYHCGQKLDWQ